MCMEFSVTFSSFPIPEVHLPEPIPWNNVLADWTEINFACVSRVVMADECFFCNLTDFIPTRVNYNFVVHRLSCEESVWWVHRYERDAMHSGISDVLCTLSALEYQTPTQEFSCHRLWTQISSHRQRMWQYYMAGGDDCIPGIFAQFLCPIDRFCCRCSQRWISYYLGDKISRRKPSIFLLE